MTKIHKMSLIFAAVGLKLTCGAILLSWFWPERAFIAACYLHETLYDLSFMDAFFRPFLTKNSPRGIIGFEMGI